MLNDEQTGLDVEQGDNEMRDGDRSLCLYLGVVGSLHHFRLIDPVCAASPASLRKRDQRNPLNLSI